jgi:hypothetical protein
LDRAHKPFFIPSHLIEVGLSQPIPATFDLLA